ncbi:hypothetical protein [Myxosarcina sp. GI1]|nr:hypothetical protein [Myxosarcina sp. GI1]
MEEDRIEQFNDLCFALKDRLTKAIYTALGGAIALPERLLIKTAY